MGWWLEGYNIRGTDEISVEVVKPRNCLLWPPYKWSANKPTEEPITWSDCMLFNCDVLSFDNVEFTAPISVAVRSRVCVCGLSLPGLRVRTPLAAWVPVSCEFCVLLHNGPIPRLEESYRLCTYPCARSGETIILYNYKWWEIGQNK
jgi:hypothetical protein